MVFSGPFRPFPLLLFTFSPLRDIHESCARSNQPISCHLAPPRPPANVTASNTTSTSIALEWVPPEGRIPGILRGYRIFYARDPDIINTTVYTTVDNEDITYHIARDMTLKNVTINDVDLTEYTVTGLEPYTSYVLWVTAFTVADSPNSHAVSRATEEDGKLN